MKASMIVAGTILAFGVTHASAGMTGLTVNYTSEVGVLLEYDEFQNYTAIGNESFDVIGGSELLSFSASAAGGDVAQNFPWGEVFVDASGSLKPGGGFEHSVDLVGNAGGFFDIPSSVRAYVSSVIEFTIDESMDFELLLLNYDYNNDAGYGGFSFKNTVTDEELIGDYFPGEIGPGNHEFIEGTIGAGTYRLSASTNYGHSQYSFNLLPAPSSMVLLGLGSVCVTCRRR